MSTTALGEDPPRGTRSGAIGGGTSPVALAPPDLGAPARTLLDVFAATVVRCADRTAIDAPDATLSYRQLADTVAGLASRLQARGIGPGDRVGVRIRSGTAELYVAILGVLHAGAAYVPVDADDPPGRAEELLGRAEVAAVLEDGLAIADGRPPRGVRRAVSPADEAWVIFTSGSTGVPKGVAISHRAAAAFVDAEAKLWAIDVEDRVLAALSVGFDASCEEMWLAWRHGAALVPAPRALVRAGAELGYWIADCQVSVVSTVPTLAAMWEAASLHGVRVLILGGEATPAALGWRLAEDREVWNTYGPTEAAVVSTAGRIRSGEPITIGWPLAGWKSAVLDDYGDPVTVGEEGELVIGGVGLGRYLDEQLDAQRFGAVPALGWERGYRTGDIVRETVHGLEFVGRRDDQVKIAGRRIELGELDARISAIPGVTAALSAVRRSASGNKLLVGYVVGDVAPEAIRARLARELPSALVPTIVGVDALPLSASGKADRRALPWPPPPQRDVAVPLEGTAAWLAARWQEQLGPHAFRLESDFFTLGGSSLGAAKLVTALRARYPAVAVADVYNFRTLGALSQRLDGLGSIDELPATVLDAGSRRGWGAVQLAGVLALVTMTAPGWLLGILALDHWHASGFGPQVGWGWLVAAWLIFASAPGRSLLVIGARLVLLRGLRPGTYPRRGWLLCRIWFVERLSQLCRLENLAGTPWAARYARWLGHDVGHGARLGTLPPATSLVTVGAGATIEADVDLHGWWIEGDELIVGRIHIGAGARLGARSLLMPGCEIGEGAEIEPGTVVTGTVPAGERWSGAPGRTVGRSGERWPAAAPAPPRRRRLWRVMYAAGVLTQSFVPLIAAGPGLALLVVFSPAAWTAPSVATEMLVLAPILAASFVISYALLVALVVRAVSPLIRPGWQPDEGSTAWALWFTESLMAASRDVLFPLYSSVFTRRWLRLAGVPIGPKTELSTLVGANRLTSFADTSFAADDVVLACARVRDGWLHVAPVQVGSRSFLGNGAMLLDETRIEDDSLVGVLTVAPRASGGGSSWLGAPALELPRRAEPGDPARTTHPPRALVIARTLTEVIRILLPASISAMLAALVFWTLDGIGASDGVWVMAAAAPLVLSAAGLLAVILTIAIKWVVIGRYASGEHPLWSWFVWRDEIINSAQEQLAGTWLLNLALGTPLMAVYLRLMGSKVGRNVWCETLTITEFDLARLGDNCAINRNSVVETHLFHDRMMRIGPATVGAGATLGPSAAMLPDTEIGDGCSVGGRSIVMRGEQLPAHTRWHGAPVIAV